MRRVVFVIPTLDQSGAERQLVLLATGLVRAGYDIHVVALNRSGPLAKPLHDAGIPIHVLGKRFRFDVLTGFRLRRLLHHLKPDIVQSYLFSANACVRLPGTCPAGTRVLISERCVDSWKSRWQRRLDRIMAKRMDAMIANSQSVAEFYAASGIPRERIHVIPNGIPFVEQTAEEREQCRRELRAELHLQEGQPLVGFAGRLAPQKRLEDLIWAFQLLHQVVDGVRLVLIGDGPDRDSLAMFARNMHCRDKIIFAGHRSDARRLLSGLDVFALPSAFEGMSNSLMEAMAAGIPVVASDIPANCELVEHDVTGLTYRLGEAPELTRALKRVLDNVELAGCLAATAMNRIRLEHSVEGLVEQHQLLYAAMTDRAMGKA
ncbi:MAG: glycosyltransferase [Planctomycetaceae bacterium]|nr:glycosyltransferase [Planctomycetaceae bacterium]